MEKLKSHKDFLIWKRSIDLVTEIYKITKQFPIEEKYGLTSQIRRCSVSVPSNIAEGAARNSTKEYIQFLYISMGSLAELDTQLIIAINLKFLNNLENILEEIKAIKLMIRSLITQLGKKI